MGSGSLLERRLRVASGVGRLSIAAAAVFGATIVWRLFTFSGFNNDHYAHLALAQQMLLGDRPIRDFADPGWPLTYLISAAAWRVAGSAMWVEWAVTATAFAAGAALTVLAAERLSGSVALAVLVAAFEVLIAPRTYAYPKILPYAAFAVLIVARGTPSTRRLVWIGLVVAAAFLLRHDHGLWIGLAALAYTALASLSDGMRPTLRRSALVIGTAAAALLPWTAFVAMHGGVLPYFQTALEFSRAEANASMLRELPWFGRGASADAWLFSLFWALPAAAAALVADSWRRGQERWPGERAAVAALVVLAVCVNVGFLRDVLRTRLADAVVPAALLGAWLLGIVLREGWAHGPVRRLVQAASVALVGTSMVSMSIVAELGEQVERTNVRAGISGLSDRYRRVRQVLGQPHRQKETMPSRVAAVLMPFFAYLDRCTLPTERLIVAGEFPDVVVLAGRRFASDGVVFGGGYSSVAFQHRTLDRLRAHPALFAILVSEADFRRRFPLVAGYVDQAYAPFTGLAEQGLHVSILALGERVPTGTDADTGWPCFT